MDELIELGKITTAHGIRGQLRADITCGDDILDLWPETVIIGGKEYASDMPRPHKNLFLMKLEGIDDMDAALALRGKTIFARKDDIELPDDMFFIDDIIGFEVFDERAGGIIGKIKKAEEYPSGLIITVSSDDGESMIPMVEPFKLGYDFENKRVNVKTIYGMLPNEN